MSAMWQACRQSRVRAAAAASRELSSPLELPLSPPSMLIRLQCTYRHGCQTCMHVCTDTASHSCSLAGTGAVQRSGHCM